MSLATCRERARAIHAQLMESPDGFTPHEFHDLLLDACPDLAATALDGLVAKVVQEIDKASISHVNNAQLELFDLDGTYAPEDNFRIAKRLARADHMQNVIQRKRLNIERAANALHRDEEELQTLMPYWGPGVTKEEAVEAYREANPQPEVA